MLKILDIPPVWLIASIAAVWMISKWDVGIGFSRWNDMAGTFLIVIGLVLTALAFHGFKKAHTTVIPGRTPDALITSGIFRYSRNPIYLADVCFLLAFVLWWNAVLALPLVFVFIGVIRVRFINWEEARLEETFGAKYTTYKERTNRWL